MKKSRFFVAALLLTVLLTACIAEPVTTPTRTYTRTEITYSDPITKNGFRADMDSVETEFAKFFFEPSIEANERDACIEATERVLFNQAKANVCPEIYVFSQDRNDVKYISDHKLYCSLQNWRSVEYVTDVLLTVYGEFAHYGTAFGYANYFAQKYEWQSINGQFSHPSTKDTLDLNHLCFDESFATHEDITLVKEIACGFVASYVQEYGEEAVEQLLTSNAKALSALSAYYEKNGESYTPSTLQYAYGGKFYDYLVYSDYATFYIAKDWIDINAAYNPLVTEGFLHSDYATTKAFFEINIKQMEQYRDLFSLDGYNDDLEIVFAKPINASKNSFYQSAEHRIYLYNVDSLMHEYIHALTQPTSSISMSLWQIEGFARYFSYYYDHYGIAFLNQDYNNAPNTATTKYIHEYLATINRPIDMAIDYRELENIAIYSFGFIDPNKNYAAGSSFVQFLVKQYGEDVVIDHIYGSGNALPKKYLELVEEWNAYIEANYQGYSKYN